jgi:uncharacterized protein
VVYGRQREKIPVKSSIYHYHQYPLLDDEIMDFLVKENLSVILSLDGRPEVNNRCRPLANGEGSYDLVLANIRRMVDKQPVSYYVRGTFTRKNWTLARICGISLISVLPPCHLNRLSQRYEYAIQPEDCPGFWRNTSTLPKPCWTMPGPGVRFISFIIILTCSRVLV